jgi:5-methylcytosine-specific restriction endonuclease McrA
MHIPQCLICLRPIASDARFSVAYPGGRHLSYQRPLSAFGLCEAHSPGPMYEVFFEDAVNAAAEYVRARPLSAPRRTAYFASSTNITRTRAPSGLKALICPPGSTCHCGAQNPQLGHLISAKLFATAGLDPKLSWFPENLVPMCIACNNAWIYAEWPADAVWHWRKRTDSRAYFWEAAQRAVRIAHHAGLRVWLVPPHHTAGRIGTPVLTPPTDVAATEWKVTGYVMFRWRQRLLAPSLARARPFHDCCASYLIPQYLRPSSARTARIHEAAV